MLLALSHVVATLRTRGSQCLRQTPVTGTAKRHVAILSRRGWTFILEIPHGILFKKERSVFRPEPITVEFNPRCRNQTYHPFPVLPVDRQAKAEAGEREPQLYAIDDVANSFFSNEYRFTSRNMPRTFTSCRKVPSNCQLARLSRRMVLMLSGSTFAQIRFN